MEIIVVLAIAGVLLAVVFVGLGSAFGRSRRRDELKTERGTTGSPQTGMGADPVRDRPAGPGAENQDAGTAGEMHPPEQSGESTEDAALPSEAAGKGDPEQDERGR